MIRTAEAVIDEQVMFVFLRQLRLSVHVERAERGTDVSSL
jgi:hypothetical protein